MSFALWRASILWRRLLSGAIAPLASVSVAPSGMGGESTYPEGPCKTKATNSPRPLLEVKDFDPRPASRMRVLQGKRMRQGCLETEFGGNPGSRKRVAEALRSDSDQR